MLFVSFLFAFCLDNCILLDRVFAGKGAALLQSLNLSKMPMEREQTPAKGTSTYRTQHIFLWFQQGILSFSGHSVAAEKGESGQPVGFFL